MRINASTKKYAQRNKTMVTLERLVSSSIFIYLCLCLSLSWETFKRILRLLPRLGTANATECILPWKSAVGWNTFRIKPQKEWTSSKKKQNKKILCATTVRRYFYTDISIAMRFVRLHKSKSSWFPRDVVTLNNFAHGNECFFPRSFFAQIKKSCKTKYVPGKTEQSKNFW